MNSEAVSQPKHDRPGVGIVVIVLSEDGRILMGNNLKYELYGFPGGHLERYESWEESGRRELSEETSIEVAAKDLKFVIVNNIIAKKEGYHYVVPFLACKMPKDQEPKNTEPEKCGGWEWWTIEEMERRKSELFYPIIVLLEKHSDVFNTEHLYKIVNR